MPSAINWDMKNKNISQALEEKYLTLSIKIVTMPYRLRQCFLSGAGMYGRTTFCSKSPEAWAQLAKSMNNKNEHTTKQTNKRRYITWQSFLNSFQKQQNNNKRKQYPSIRYPSVYHEAWRDILDQTNIWLLSFSVEFYLHWSQEWHEWNFINFYYFIKI